MKYLLVEDKEQEEQVLLDNIAEFFWNNGNEVYSRNSFDNEIDYQDVVKCCDCIVLLIYRDYLGEPFFEHEQGVFHKDFDTEKSLNKKFMLVFSINGVYSNAIPFPHKIFHFESLCQKELTRFFRWCGKLNLFTKHPPYTAYQNLILL